MNIFGPHSKPPAHPIEPVDHHPDDQEKEEKRRRRTSHRGRTWDQRDKGDVEPSFPQYVEGEEKRQSLYGQTSEVEEARALLQGFVTLEEKVAQLCFYQTEAVYDTSIQQHVELLIQAWQIGGILFTRGQYRRQAYLIERYQELSKTALLIGNDFLHGLSFYFEGSEFPNLQQPGLEKRFSDLGKAVMGLNRKLAVHFQFDRERTDKRLALRDEQIQAFRKGVRQAHGIVARQMPPNPRPLSHTTKRPILSAPHLSMPIENADIQEQVAIKSLNFLDLTEDRIYEEKLVKAFQENYDAFLFSSNIQDAIRMICRAIKIGRISETELERRVMKLLVLKAQYT